MQIDGSWLQSALLVGVAVGILVNFIVRLIEAMIGRGMGFFSLHRKKTFSEHLIHMRKLAEDPRQRDSFFQFHWADLAFNAFGALVSTIAFFSLSGRQLGWPSPDFVSWLLTLFALLVLFSVANVLRQIWNLRVSALWLNDIARAEAWFLKTFKTLPDGYVPMSPDKKLAVASNSPTSTKPRRLRKTSSPQLDIPASE